MKRQETSKAALAADWLTAAILLAICIAAAVLV
jgi:hypothetical protein